MINLIHITFLLVALVNPPSRTVTPEEVLAVMSQVPEETSLYGHGAQTPAGFDKKKDAREIAEAIAAGVTWESDPRKWVVLGVVYAAYESANRRCVSGDGGKSWGAWQVQGLARDKACTPMNEFPVWLAKAKASLDYCADLPEDERLAALASGNCEHGRVKVRTRMPLVRRLMELQKE